MQVERGGARRSRFSVEQPGLEDSMVGLGDSSVEGETVRLEHSQVDTLTACSRADEKTESVKLRNIAVRSDKLSTPVVKDQEQPNKETPPIMTDCPTEEKPPKVDQSKAKVLLNP